MVSAPATASTAINVPSTCKVCGLFWTSTLSMITWVTIGFARANNCTKNEAMKTSMRTFLCFFRAGRNQRRPNFWRSSPSGARIRRTSRFSGRRSAHSERGISTMPETGEAITQRRGLASTSTAGWPCQRRMPGGSAAGNCCCVTPINWPWKPMTSEAAPRVKRSGTSCSLNFASSTLRMVLARKGRRKCRATMAKHASAAGMPGPDDSTSYTGLCGSAASARLTRAVEPAAPAAATSAGGASSNPAGTPSRRSPGGTVMPSSALPRGIFSPEPEANQRNSGSPGGLPVASAATIRQASSHSLARSRRACGSGVCPAGSRPIKSWISGKSGDSRNLRRASGTDSAHARNSVTGISKATLSWLARASSSWTPFRADAQPARPPGSSSPKLSGSRPFSGGASSRPRPSSNRKRESGTRPGGTMACPVVKRVSLPAPAKRRNASSPRPWRTSMAARRSVRLAELAVMVGPELRVRGAGTATIPRGRGQATSFPSGHQAGRAAFFPAAG